MQFSGSLSQIVLLATLAFTLWGGIVLGPRRVVPVLLIFGPLFLPARGVIPLSGLPDLDRVTVVTLPALLLVWLTPRECWARLRFRWPDVLLLAFVAWAGLCTALAQGAYAGAAMGLRYLLTLVVPYFAGRLYVQDRRDLIALARIMAPLALVYLGLMVFEARFYPRLQEWVYGDPVVGLGRFGLYRPVVFAENTLELGHTLVLFAAVMLAWLRGGSEDRLAGGRLLAFGLVAACLGVVLTMSRGPILGLALVFAFSWIWRRTGTVSAWLAIAGSAFFFWMLTPGAVATIVDVTGTDPKTESGQTLWYRFLQIEAFRPMVEASPWFGHGESWERVEMPIIDGELLLTVLGFGYPGAILLCAFWISCVYAVGATPGGSRGPFGRLGVALAPALGWLVFTSWGDSFLRVPHYVVLGGAMGALGGLRRRGVARQRTAFREIELRYG